MSYMRELVMDIECELHRVGRYHYMRLITLRLKNKMLAEGHKGPYYFSAYPTKFDGFDGTEITISDHRKEGYRCPKGRGQFTSGTKPAPQRDA